MHARPIRSSLGPDPNGSAPVCTGLKSDPFLGIFKLTLLVQINFPSVSSTFNYRILLKNYLREKVPYYKLVAFLIQDLEEITINKQRKNELYIKKFLYILYFMSYTLLIFSVRIADSYLCTGTDSRFLVYCILFHFVCLSIFIKIAESTCFCAMVFHQRSMNVTHAK